jgi:hypothetical protein
VLETSFAIADNVGLMGFTVIPLCPIWPGLAIDTAFYAAIWCALLLVFMFSPRHVLRVRRLARGLCPRCCYPFHGAERCPECGTDIDLGPGRVTTTRIGAC